MVRLQSHNGPDHLDCCVAHKTSAFKGYSRLEILILSISQIDPDRNSLDGQLCNAKESFSFDVGRLDDRPPLFDFGLLKFPQGLGRLPVTRENLLPYVSQPSPHRRVGQGVHDCLIEFGGDSPRRTLRQPKPMPQRDVKPWQSSFAHCWEIR